MRTLFTIFTCLALTLSATTVSSARSDDGDTPLQESMGELNSGLRAFRRSIKGDSPDKEAALAKVVEMQAAIQTSKVETPEIAAAMKPADGRAMTISFRKDLIEVQKELLSLEVLILDDDFKSADASIRRLLEMKKSGHDKYIEDA